MTMARIDHPSHTRGGATWLRRVAIVRPWEAETSGYGFDGKDLAIERVLDGSPYRFDGKDAAIERWAPSSSYILDGKDLAIDRGR